MIHVKAAFKVAAASGIIGSAILQVGAVAAGIEHSVVDEVLSGLLLAVLGGGLKVWSDQRSDQRAWRHEKQTRMTVDQQNTERFERLEQRTEAAIRLEENVVNLGSRLSELHTATEDVRRLNTDNNGMLSYLKGRADQADADYRRRRQADT